MAVSFFSIFLLRSIGPVKIGIYKKKKKPLDVNNVQVFGYEIFFFNLIIFFRSNGPKMKKISAKKYYTLLVFLLIKKVEKKMCMPEHFEGRAE